MKTWQGEVTFLAQGTWKSSYVFLVTLEQKVCFVVVHLGDLAFGVVFGVAVFGDFATGIFAFGDAAAFLGDFVGDFAGDFVGDFFFGEGETIGVVEAAGLGEGFCGVFFAGVVRGDFLADEGDLATVAMLRFFSSRRCLCASRREEMSA